MVKNNVVDFTVGDTVVYPSHGVGQITNEEIQTVAGLEVKLYVISFAKDRMILRVPVGRALKTGLRHLSSQEHFSKALEVLRTRVKLNKGVMWNKRAQEYENKINSGDIVLIAEVLRELHINIKNDRSYSEQMIYDSALSRLSNEYSAVMGLDLKAAADAIVEILNTSNSKVAA